MHCINIIATVFLIHALKPISADPLLVKIMPLYGEYSDDIDSPKEINFRRSDDLVYEGRFSRFIFDLLNLLTNNYPEKRMRQFFKTLNRNLREMPYKYAKKLGKFFLKLAKDEAGEIELAELKQDLNKEMPRRREFIDELNEVYTLQQSVRFNDFVLDLRDYGNRDILFIEDETRKLLHDVILNPILKLSAKRLRSLEKKLNKAVKEYGEEIDDDEYRQLKEMMEEHNRLMGPLYNHPSWPLKP